MKRPRVIWFNIDGLRPDIFHDVLESGKLKTFSRLFSQGKQAEKCISVFPTSTIPCQAALVTGAMPAANLIPADAWFDRYGKFPLYRDYNSTRDGLRLFCYEPFGLPTLILPDKGEHPIGESDLSGATQTLFDAVKARNVRTAAAFTPFSRNANEWVRPSRSDIFKYKLCADGRLKCSVFDKAAAKRILYLIEDEEHLQRILIFNLPGCNGHSHWHGPSAQADYLENTLENIMARIIGAIDKHHSEKEVFFVLSSSHGLTAVSEKENRRINSRRLRGLFESLGFRCYNPGEHNKAKQASAVLIPAGNSASVYIRNRDNEHWYEPPRLEQDLVDTAVEITARSKRQTGNLPPGWLDFILVNDYHNGDYKIYKDGKLYGRKEFFTLPGNSEKYPGASRRVANLRNKRSADLVLLANTDEGFHFSDPGYKGAHGGLSRDDSLCTLMFAGPGIEPGVLPDESGIIDIVPTIAAIYDLPVLGAEGRLLPIFSS